MPRIACFLWLCTCISAASAAVLQVGPTRSYTVPSAALNVAGNGDVIEIDAGTYLGDVAYVDADNLTIRGVGGLAVLDANGNNKGGKGTWVVRGDNTTIEYIDFRGATVPDNNGAGIRLEGAGLTVRHCRFVNNQNGILCGVNANSDLLIEYSEFDNNGYGDGYTHNLYIGHIRSFVMRYCYSHRSQVGHLVKSRALRTELWYCRLTSEDGQSSYEVDVPNGGLTILVGNLIQQGATQMNSNIVRYAAEGGSNPIQALYMVHNTIVNDRWAGTFVSGIPTTNYIANNLFVGPGTAVGGNGNVHLNTSGGGGLVDRANYDYHLLEGAAAIDAGVPIGTVDGFDLTPASQYVHPTQGEARPVNGAPDAGAYEFGSATILRTISINDIGSFVWDCQPAGVNQSTAGTSVHAALDSTLDHVLAPLLANNL